MSGTLSAFAIFSKDISNGLSGKFDDPSTYTVPKCKPALIRLALSSSVLSIIS